MNESPPNGELRNHSILTALSEGTFLDRMFEILAPGQWYEPTEKGFSWIPHRLQHNIEILEVTNPSGDAAVACRSTFVVCCDISDDTSAFLMCDHLNRRSVGAAFIYDILDRRIIATSSVHLDLDLWVYAFIFEMTIPSLVGILENLAPRLAELVGGRVPDAAHPAHGQRLVPDQLLRDACGVVLQPEAGCGLWWSQHELKMFRRSLQVLLKRSGNLDAANAIDPASFDPTLTAAANLFEEVILGSDETWLSLVVQQARHPDFGQGLEILLSSALVIGEETGIDDGSGSSNAALIAANTLNLLQHTFCQATANLGGWAAWRSQLVHSTFVMPEFVTSMQIFAAPVVGEVLALLARSSLDHFSNLQVGTASLQGFDERRIATSRRWPGVKHSTGHHATLIDSNEPFGVVGADIPLNTILEPLELDESALLLPTEYTFVSMGIFNPSGPSVGTIEIAIDNRLGRAFLIDRLRHFLSPSIRLHAVLDQDGLERVDEFLEDVVARLQWSTFDWWDTGSSMDSSVGAMERGLRRFAGQRSGFDFGRHAMSLMETLDNPWDRLSSNFSPAYSFEEGTDEVGAWIDAISHARNIDNHVAHIRSAWEGARVYYDSAVRGAVSPQDAQSTADRLIGVVDQRKAGQGNQ